MNRRLVGAGVSGILLSCVPAAAYETRAAGGSLVDVAVVVDGATAPLYPAPDGSGRFYLEALRGAAYEVRIDNRSHERIGVALSVDGLNAISGERDRWLAWPNAAGRMYVLEPWEGTRVRGWRTSLAEVHRFTFVDEAASYAARTGKANARMGWIEVAVYREQRPFVRRDRSAPITPSAGGRDEVRAMPTPPATAPPSAAAEAPREGAIEQHDAKRHDDFGRSYPGTGWGRHEWDQAVVVDFHAFPEPAERITLRYEYASALTRLGVVPRWPPRDRLSERERGREGFARPPR